MKQPLILVRTNIKSVSHLRIKNTQIVHLQIELKRIKVFCLSSQHVKLCNSSIFQTSPGISYFLIIFVPLEIFLRFFSLFLTLLTHR